MSSLHTQMVVACGVSTSLLHAARVLVDNALGKEGDKDYCAIMTLLDAAAIEVSVLAGLADDMLRLEEAERPRASRRSASHSLPPEAAATGEAFQPHQNGEDA